jgi:hypothetical protein
VIRAVKPGRYSVDEISGDPLPAGHTSRRWGVAIKRADATVVIEPDPSEKVNWHAPFGPDRVFSTLDFC